MHTGNPDLVAFIRETIRQRGPVTFDWFMEQALYHPEFGPMRHWAARRLFYERQRRSALRPVVGGAVR